MATWPAGKDKLTEEAVTSHCRTKIESGIVGQACKNVLGIKFDIEIKSCIEDIKVIH